jgi:hypothetical protein
LSFENRQEARKLGLLPPGKSFEAVCERLEPQERKERVFKGQPDIDDFNCIIWVNLYLPAFHKNRFDPYSLKSFSLKELLTTLMELTTIAIAP